MSIPKLYNPRQAYATWKAWMQVNNFKMTKVAHLCAEFWPSAYSTLNILSAEKKLTVTYLARLYAAQQMLPPRELQGITPDDLAKGMIDEYPALRLQHWQAIVKAMEEYAREGGKLYPKPEQDPT